MPPPAQTLHTTHDDITYDHQAAHSAALLAPHDLRDAARVSSASDALQSSSSGNDLEENLAPTSNSRMSFFDEEYVQGRRVPSPPATIEIDFEPPEEIANLRVEIERVLASTGWVPDFKAARIPSLQRDATTHLALQALLSQRIQTETELNAMYSDKAPDGTPLDPEQDLEGDYNRMHPGRDFEKDYHRLNALYIDLNRRMYTLFLDYLNDPSRPQRKRKAQDMALSAIMHIPPPNTSNAARTDIGPPCPYVHIAALPTPPLTSPLLEHIHFIEEGHRAMIASTVPSPYANSVSAIADSGASHVLFRLSDAHILSNTEFSSSKPYAALTAANHATIIAIGRGTLTVQNLAITAFIFRINPILQLGLYISVPAKNVSDFLQKSTDTRSYRQTRGYSLPLECQPPTRNG